MIDNIKEFNNIQPITSHVDLQLLMDGLHVLGLLGHKNSI